MITLRTLTELFGLKPLYDADLIDEPVDWPTDWDSIRDGLQGVREALIDAVSWIDQIDPTPTGLADAVNVTDIKKGRQS